jgi:hypothetical protein
VLTTDVVLRVSDGAGTTFPRREQAVGDGFNMLAARFADGFFTTDYEALAANVKDPRSVHTFFTATTCEDTRCAAVAGFDADGNPIASGAPNPTDVFGNTDRAG